MTASGHKCQIQRSVAVARALSVASQGYVFDETFSNTTTHSMAMRQASREASARKLASTRTRLAATHPASRCQHYMERKQRFCSGLAKNGSSYCGNHAVGPVSRGKRVPCPIDPRQCVAATQQFPSLQRAIATQQCSIASFCPVPVSLHLIC